MSTQRKAHPNLMICSEYSKSSRRAKEHDSWIRRNIWKTGLHLKRKRWKRWKK